MPAPSPPGLKSSIEYLAMSVGIGRTLYGPPSLLVLLDQRYENIGLVTILKGSAPKAPHTNSCRGHAIVKNMLLHSRQGSGEHRPVDINALVEESLNLAYHGLRITLGQR